jgi:hypothetical protein
MMAIDDGPDFDPDDISFRALDEEQAWRDHYDEVESMREIQDEIDALDDAHAETLERYDEYYDQLDWEAERDREESDYLAEFYD